MLRVTCTSVCVSVNGFLRFKGVTAKMSLSLSLSGHTLVMESLKLGPRVKVFKEENDLSNLTLGPSLEDSITKVWPEIERFSHIFAVTSFILWHGSSSRRLE